MTALTNPSPPDRLMLRNPTLLFTLALSLAATPALAGNGNGNGNTTLICHVTGNGTVNSIYVNANAIAAHLGHGDFAPITFFADLDGDGFGDPNDTIEACEAPAGYVTDDTDCDDLDAGINPAAAEICGDGIDNNCDGDIDEDCGPCDTSESSTCSVDLTTGAVSCDNGNPVTLLRVDSYGPVYEIDMSTWTAAVALMDIDLPDYLSDNWALSIGNSPTNNGWSGDGSSNANDSEVQLYNNSVHLFENDFGGSSLVFGQNPATDLSGDVVEATVCDGYFAWENNAGFSDYSSPFVFQIDGDESDPQAGGLNDSLLYLGVGQVVVNGLYPPFISFRNGTGVQSMSLTFWR